MNENPQRRFDCEKSIIERLRETHMQDPERIMVRVEGHEAILIGVTQDQGTKNTIVDIAKENPEVTEVHDHLITDSELQDASFSLQEFLQETLSVLLKKTPDMIPISQNKKKNLVIDASPLEEKDRWAVQRALDVLQFSGHVIVETRE
jgi:hypothetical protein